MEKAINTYETTFIVNPNLGDEAVKALVEKFTAMIADNATIIEVSEWGKRRMAYAINDIPDGYYVIVRFNSDAAFPAELERVFGITEGILRSMVIREREVAAPAEA